MLIKNDIIKTFIITFLVIGVSACSDYLDVVPDDIATLDDAFDDQLSAEGYLFACYSWMPNLGNADTNPAFYGGDEAYRNDLSIPTGGVQNFTFRMTDIALGLQNADTPIGDYWKGANGGKNMHDGIRDCNVFLENIDKVPVIDEDLKRRWIAEAKFLKAYYHFYLFRMYGPIVISDENLPVDSDIEDIQRFRSPVDDCVNYIADLFLEASRDLPGIIPDPLTELGRATSGAALALRARVLTMAASPLFNGNGDYNNVIDKNGIKLFPEFDANKWNIAAEACKTAVDSIENLGIALYTFDKTDLTLPVGVTLDQVPDEIVNTLTIQQSLAERWTDEKLFVSTEGLANAIQRHAMARTSNRFSSNGGVYSIYSPTLRIAEMFYTKNGVPIDEDITWDYGNRFQLRQYNINTDEDFDNNGIPDNQYFVKNGQTTINLHFDRETRFYGSLGFDRGIWYGNPATYSNAPAGFESHYLEARGGEYSGNSVGLGKESQTGYYAKKLTNYDNTIRHDNQNVAIVTYAFPEIRLADLYLLYAECLNEIDDRNTAYIYIDKVRERANLKGVVESWTNFSNNPGKPASKSGFREIIQQERMIELVFEGQRFWDLKRWKLAEQYLNRAFRGWNFAEPDAIDYYSTPRILTVPEYTFKNNLWPIDTDEILSNPNTVQNGGW